MLSNPLFLLGTSTLFASVPAAIWLYLIFTKAEKSKKTVALIFLLGCLTAPALLGLQYLWDIFPQFNLSAFIEENIKSQSKMYIAMFVLFGALEEIIKHYVITIVDKKTVLIEKLGDSIRYSLAAALGFSFTENIYYLYQFWPSISVGELTGMYIFRSIFTTCAHLIFSGIFGYFYGIGKFSISITEQIKLTGKTSKIAKLISKVFSIPLSHAYQQKMVLKGLFIAIFAHATYNFFLQVNYVLPVILSVIIGASYIYYLLKRRTGNLVLTTDISEEKKSTLAKKDEDVVIELLGMWFQDKRYADVIHVCQRLLERDPDNKVVKLFKEKALDKTSDENNVYRKILRSIFKSKEDLDESQKNIISKHLEENDMLKKVKNMIKKEMEKEGKTFIDSKKQNQEKKEDEGQKISSKNVLDKYTGEGTFKMGD